MVETMIRKRTNDRRRVKRIVNLIIPSNVGHNLIIPCDCGHNIIIQDN